MCTIIQRIRSRQCAAALDDKLRRIVARSSQCPERWHLLAALHYDQLRRLCTLHGCLVPRRPRKRDLLELLKPIYRQHWHATRRQSA